MKPKISNQYFSIFKRRGQEIHDPAPAVVETTKSANVTATPAVISNQTDFKLTYPQLGAYGRLGNQMFQIAATIGIARDNGLNPIFPKWICKYENIDFSNYFKTPIVQDAQFNVNQYQGVYNEPAFNYIQVMLSPTMNYSLSGYFQTERYFQNHEEEVRRVFEFKDEFIQPLKIKYNIDSNTCAIHVRRGDYLNMPHIHPVLSNNQYYRRAMSTMPSNTNYIVFSDDISWCHSYFKGIPNLRFSEETKGIYDMMIMSTCANFIISNSSFSWWGAWLSSNINKTVVTPAAWFGPGVQHNDKDIIPQNWIRI